MRMNRGIGLVDGDMNSYKIGNNKATNEILEELRYLRLE